MEIDPAKLQELIARSFLLQASRAFGDEGASGIKRLLDEVRLIYQQFEAASVTKSLTVVFGIEADQQGQVLGSSERLQKRRTIQGVAEYLSANNSDAALGVEICLDGSYRVGKFESPLDLEAIASSAIVYHFENKEDRILSGEHSSIVEKVYPGLVSNFASPTMDSLEEVLVHYGEHWALNSRCRILKGIWEGGVDGPRLVLKNRPEATMRDSLCQAIDMMLRDANARPEHNTDETKPVDIIVSWYGTRSEAIIEVKWLGRSLSKSTKTANGNSYTNYARARAQEGADQLADYLDREVRHTGATTTWGYLAVFDARRKGVTDADVPISRNDAFHFRYEEVHYDPDHSKSRDDFGQAFRFFLNPKESHCLADA